MTNRNRLPALLALLAVGILATAGIAYASEAWVAAANEYPSSEGTLMEVQTGNAPMGTMVFAYWVDTTSGQEILMDADTIDPSTGTAWVTFLPHVSAYKLTVGFTPDNVMASGDGYIGSLEHD